MVTSFVRCENDEGQVNAPFCEKELFAPGFLVLPGAGGGAAAQHRLSARFKEVKGVEEKFAPYTRQKLESRNQIDLDLSPVPCLNGSCKEGHTPGEK